MVNQQRSKVLDVVARTLVGVSVTGVAVHWTVRDGRSFATSLFYALPLIVIAGILLAAGVVWMRNRRPVFSAASNVAPEPPKVIFRNQLEIVTIFGQNRIVF